jgi:hypothetical protein
VKWARDTPVIVLEKVSIPGLRTFSARVLLDEGRYAGTWTHDKKGGHLFGTITPAGEEPAESQPNRTSSARALREPCARALARGVSGTGGETPA